MDAQAIITTTQGIIQTITQALTPAAKVSYQIAVMGAKMQALNALVTCDIPWSILGLMALLVSVLSCSMAVFIIGKQKDCKCIGTCLGVALGAFVTGVALLLANIGDAVFDYQMYQHPDAYLAYQIINKVTA